MSPIDDAEAAPLRSIPNVVYPSVLPPQPQVAATHSPSSSSPHLNPSVVVIVVILSVVFVLSGFLHLLARCLGRRRNARAPQRHHSPLVSALHGQLQHLFHLHDAGVEQAFIDTLPVFSYGSIRGLKDSADCAVCLTEFGDEDRLRLLPKCKHAFHIECIDTWLLSNSTCPLCRRSLLPDPGRVCDEVGASTSDMMHSNRFICPSQDPHSHHLVASSLHGSIHGSYQNSFRICDVDSAESENEIQEIHDSPAHSLSPPRVPLDTPSPFAPTVRILDSHGEPRVLKVHLGHLVRTTAGSSDTRQLTRQGARSYSMGSYEYVVDPASWELRMAPTPYPGRKQDWASDKPRHRSALSDSIPELGSSSVGGTPAKDDLFWASRGLYTPHTLSRVRELLTPIGSEYSGAGFSPADYALQESPGTGGHGDRWIDIDIERGEIVEETSTRWSSSSSTSSSPIPTAAPPESAPESPEPATLLEPESVDPGMPKQRCSSLSRLPEGKVSVSWYRRSLSETSAGLEHVVKDIAAAEGLGGSAKHVVAATPASNSFSRRFSLNWLMGRDKRMVFSATSPSPEAVTTDQRTRPITI